MNLMPKIFLPYQIRWTSERHPFRICVKSRRIGITWAQAADDVITAATTKSAGGKSVLYIGYNQDMTREYIDTCTQWARKFEKVAEFGEEDFFDGLDSIRAFSLYFASGHKILALSSSPRNLRGKQGRVVIDEAAFHDDLDGLIKASAAMKIWGGETVVISTYNGVNNDFYRLVEAVRAGSRPGAVHQTTFDEAIHEGLAKRVFFVTGQEWTPLAELKWRDEVVAEHGGHADEELFCIPQTGEGGGFFDLEKIHWQNGTPIPIGRLVRAWDRAASRPSASYPDPDWTVGVLYGRISDDRWCIFDVKMTRDVPSGVEDFIQMVAELDGRDVRIAQWQDPGAAGKSDVDHYRRNVLPGFSLDTVLARKSKLIYAGPPSSVINAGKMVAVNGAWKQVFMKWMSRFPSSQSHDDVVDALSLAHKILDDEADPIERLRRLNTLDLGAG